MLDIVSRKRFHNSRSLSTGFVSGCGPNFLQRLSIWRRRLRKYRDCGMMWAAWFRQKISISSSFERTRFKFDMSLESRCHSNDLVGGRRMQKMRVFIYHPNTILIYLGVHSPCDLFVTSSSVLGMTSVSSTVRKRVWTSRSESF